MSITQTQDVLRPVPAGLKGRLMALVMPWVMETVLPLGLRLLRWLRWNPRFGKLVVASRYDEVREVFLNDPSFRVPYAANLNIIMGGHPFFLSMDDTDEYRRNTSGYGLHQCFGIHMNMALLPLMLKALLKRPKVWRAPGTEGRLRKRGAFADRLQVCYD